MRQHDGDEQRLLLAGGAAGRRHRLGGVGDDQISSVRALKGAGRSGIARPAPRQSRSQIIGVIGGQCDQWPGKWPIRRATQFRRQCCHHIGARIRDGGAMLGHVGLQPGQPHRIGWAIGGEQARAFAHRRLIAVHALAVAGVQRQHQPIKEAPPAAAAFAEQAVHRRGEPHQSQPIAERRRRRRGTVHPHQPAFGCCGGRAGADLHFAFSRDQMRCHAPAARPILPRRI